MDFVDINSRYVNMLFSGLRAIFAYLSILRFRRDYLKGFGEKSDPCCGYIVNFRLAITGVLIHSTIARDKHARFTSLFTHNDSAFIDPLKAFQGFLSYLHDQYVYLHRCSASYS